MHVYPADFHCTHFPHEVFLCFYSMWFSVLGSTIVMCTMEISNVYNVYPLLLL